MRTHDSLELSTVELVRARGELLKVDVWPNVHLPRVDFHDACPSVLLGQRELNLSVQSS